MSTSQRHPTPFLPLSKAWRHDVSNGVHALHIDMLATLCKWVEASRDRLHVENVRLKEATRSMEMETCSEELLSEICPPAHHASIAEVIE
ncbi:hypothetical protein [Dyella lipolytica]|uniref:Uncharacterized protein n=1 Tax=Dyella lipolytica TaxID=1867835 RepID=A0ABW8IY46_9GAMM|nr:hypothetical protein [Dyella lipolytica]